MTHPPAHPVPDLQQAETDVFEPTRLGIPPLPWFALIVAMFAAALLWLRMADHGTVAGPSQGERISATALPAAVPAAAQHREGMQVRQAAPERNAAARRAAATPRNRQAQPLAGNPKPDYPPAALRNGVQGSLVASLEVGRDGRVSDAEIISHSGTRDRELDRAVLRAVRQWRFQPALEDGRAVTSVVRVPVDFCTGR